MCGRARGLRSARLCRAITLDVVAGEESDDALVAGSGWLEAGPAVGARIEHEPALDLEPVLRPEAGFPGLAAGDQVAQLRHGELSPGRLEPHDELATPPPPPASPATRSGDEYAEPTPRAGQLRERRRRGGRG